MNVTIKHMAPNISGVVVVTTTVVADNLITPKSGGLYFPQGDDFVLIPYGQMLECRAADDFSAVL